MTVIKFDSLAEMVEAMKREEIPSDVVSPGRAAAMLGVTRQAVNDRLYHSNTLDAWTAEGYLLISEDSINKALLSSRRRVKSL